MSITGPEQKDLRGEWFQRRSYQHLQDLGTCCLAPHQVLGSAAHFRCMVFCKSRKGFRRPWCSTVHHVHSTRGFSSVQFSCSVVSDSLRPHELQHARPPCPSPTPRVHPDSCPSSQWCHPAISSSVAPFSSCPQSLPASESFPMSQLFTWAGQSIGVLALASFLPRNPRTDLQNGLVGSPWSPRDSQESSPTPQFKSINSSALTFLHSPTLKRVQATNFGSVHMAPSLLAPKVHELWVFKGWGHREPQICDSSWQWLQGPCKEFFQAIQMSLEGRTSSKEDYSWTLRAHGVCLVAWTSLGSLIPLFFPISPFWNGDAYPMPVPWP